MIQSVTGAAVESVEAEAAEWCSREYLLCPPVHFDVVHTSNPWMNPAVAVDRSRALTQWHSLRRTYEELGHTVHTLEPAAGLVDMVFVANPAVTVGGRVFASRFRHSERQVEVAHLLAWADRHGLGDVVPMRHHIEGEGDVTVVGSRILAAYGFRTQEAAHRELKREVGREVTSLELVDPRFYHLDTALGCLDESTVAYFPAAFSAASQQLLRELYPDAVTAAGYDAKVLGMNFVSDGTHVVLEAAAQRLGAQIRERGYEVVPVEMTEFHKSGGGIKCCTQEIRR